MESLLSSSHFILCGELDFSGEAHLQVVAKAKAPPERERGNCAPSSEVKACELVPSAEEWPDLRPLDSEGASPWPAPPSQGHFVCSLAGSQAFIQATSWRGTWLMCPSKACPGVARGDRWGPMLSPSLKSRLSVSLSAVRAFSTMVTRLFSF